MKSKIIKILIACFVVIFLFWLLSVIKINIQTLIYGSEFFVPEEEIFWIGENGNLKVIEYTQHYAKIYYISDHGGFIINFSNIENLWNYDGWSVVWSTTGNANGFIWPYFQHSEGGVGLIFVTISIIFFYSLIKLFKILIKKNII